MTSNKAISQTKRHHFDFIYFQDVESTVVIIHQQQVIEEADVADLYVATKRVNEAIRNLDKFPTSYLFGAKVALAASTNGRYNYLQ